jgi:hypothetical protein
MSFSRVSHRIVAEALRGNRYSGVPLNNPRNRREAVSLFANGLRVPRGQTQERTR